MTARPPMMRPTVVCWSCRATVSLSLSLEPATATVVADSEGVPIEKPDATSPILWHDDRTAVEFHCPACDARQGYDLADL